MKVAVVLCLSGAVLNGACAQSERQSAAKTVGRSESGLLFVDGQHIKPPYLIESNGKQVWVNHVALPVMSSPAWQPAHETKADRIGARRARRGHHPGRHRAERIGPPAPGKHAQEITSALESDGLVVVFENEPVQTLMSSIEKLHFCEGLIADSPTKDDRLRFQQLGSTEAGQTRWAKWFDEFQPEPSLMQTMEDYVSTTRAAEHQIGDQIAAEERLERYAYPLTIFGMLLGIGSFAHLMRWSRVGFLPADAGATNDSRLITLAMAMIAAMSLFDLMWTILASQAGVMAEVNPIAGYFIDSPAGLAAFKVAMTGFGMGVLYFSRSRRIAQQATWMACFVCTLLTFRWVMFESML